MGVQLVPLAIAADHLSVTEQTVRNYIRRGFFPAYRVRGHRGLMVDLAEADKALGALPLTVARPGRTAYGPRARIIDLGDRLLAGQFRHVARTESEGR